MTTVVSINDTNVKFKPFSKKEKGGEEDEKMEKIREKLQKSKILESIIHKKIGLTANPNSVPSTETQAPPKKKETKVEDEEDKASHTSNPLDSLSLQEQRKIKNRKSKKFLKQEELALLRSARICCVEGYFKSDRFGEYLKKKINVDVDRIRELSDDKLDELYMEIRTQMDYRYKEKFVDGMIKGGLNIVEGMVSPIFPMPGFTLFLMNDPSFLDCLEEMKLELPSTRLPLSVRMGGIMIQTALICNRMAEQGHAPSQDHPAPNSTENNKFVNTL